jgi:hypothetical protein
MSKLLLSAVVVTATTCSTLALARQSTPRCQSAGPVVQLSGLGEASGAAASRRHPGRIWAHNDSGQPVLVALDNLGKVAGRTRLTGLTVEDWEATAVGPCPGGSCLYVGDIGDNRGARKRITVHRLREPDSTSAEAAVQETFHATYPDGPHDAETLLVTPKGDILIVTKAASKAVGLYRFPRDVQAGANVVLTRVDKTSGSKAASLPEKVTDGAVSPDGAWITLRTNRTLHFYAASELIAGSWHERMQMNLSSVGEPQGEGVTFADNHTLYLVGEGGGRSRPGTFARLTCTL